jgi:four helix bundle protein
MKSYKELDAWKKSRILVKKVYQLTKKLPPDERFDLISQMRRCCVSVPANIAEGLGRNTTKDTIQFLHISRGSLYELETYFILCGDLEYLSESECNNINEEINSSCMVLNGLISYLERKK